MKRMIFGLLILSLVFACATVTSAQEKEDRRGRLLGKIQNQDINVKQLMRTAFVVKGKDGKEWLLIRLTFGQCSRAKAQIKEHGIYRFILHLRQRQAIKRALKLEKPAILPKVILRVSGKRLCGVKFGKDKAGTHFEGLGIKKGLGDAEAFGTFIKDHIFYVVRPADRFKSFVQKARKGTGAVEDESAETGDLPSVDELFTEIKENLPTPDDMAADKTEDAEEKTEEKTE